MTDAEVVCAWMDPRPKDGTHPGSVPETGWWKAVFVYPANQWRWFPNDDKTDSLDALWEVEERLPDEQRLPYYWLELAKGGPPETAYWRVVHATSEQKIAALAAVLRPLVEGAASCAPAHNRSEDPASGMEPK